MSIRSLESEIGDDVPCSSLAVDSILRIGTAGVIWGLCTGPYDANKQGLASLARASFVAKCAGKFGFQCGLFAGVFSVTRCGIQRYRNKNDCDKHWLWSLLFGVNIIMPLQDRDPIRIIAEVEKVNALMAGAIAGAAVGAGTRSWKQVAGMSGLLSAFSAIAGDSISN